MTGAHPPGAQDFFLALMTSVVLCVPYGWPGMNYRSGPNWEGFGVEGDHWVQGANGQAGGALGTSLDQALFLMPFPFSSSLFVSPSLSFISPCAG